MRKYLVIILLLLATIVRADCTGTLTGSMGAAAAGATNYVNDANCMGAWYMNGTTTETDRSGNSQDLSAKALDNPASSVTVPSGYSGNSRDFEQSDDGDCLYKADGGSLDINGADQDITLVCWVLSDDIDYTESGGIVGKYGISASERAYRLSVTSAEVASFNISRNGTDYANMVGTTDIVDGSWHHLAGVYNDSDGKLYLYVDKVLQGTPALWTAGIKDSAASFAIGANYDDDGLYFDGLIDEVAVFNRALSLEEITEIYTYGLTGNKGGSD